MWLESLHWAVNTDLFIHVCGKLNSCFEPFVAICFRDFDDRNLPFTDAYFLLVSSL